MPTLSETLVALFRRDITQLKHELALYSNEANIWKVDGAVLNSAGNLTLHLIGNLNTYIGAEIGKTGYVRNRPLEFSDKNVSREVLFQKIDDTLSVIENAIYSITESDYQKEYPLLVFDKMTTTEFFLIHLTTHLAYHLGQINYHRRLLDCYDK
jgi:Protein of unknown function (DUF1572)